MTTTPDPVRAALLVRPSRTRSRLARGLGGLTLLAVPGLAYLARDHAPSCRDLSPAAPTAVVISACERDYVRTGDPAAGVRLAAAQLCAGHRAVASAIATGLLVTNAQYDALQVLSAIDALDHPGSPTVDRERKVPRSR